MKNRVKKYIDKVIKQKGAVFTILLDPDKTTPKELFEKVKNFKSAGIDLIFFGGSLMMKNNFEECLKSVKKKAELPVIIFPGSSSHLSHYADAVLYISLISGRNPNYLFGEHVLSAPIIKEMKLETIATGYILIESGNSSAVEIISSTRPLPRTKPEIVMAHALAAQYLGMDFVYLEAGSGAEKSVPDELIKLVCGYIDIPVITGGGIKTPQDAHNKVKAGASIVVIGNKFEEDNKISMIKDFADAIHTK